jgi:hypothetical protein
MNQQNPENRIRELEAEVARLRSQQGRSSEYTVKEDTYKGHPVLVFAPPNAKPFTLGAAKLRAVQKCWKQVETFLAKHARETQANAGSVNVQI